MAYTAADIQMAERHIALGEQHIVRQEELISRLQQLNLPTNEAEDLLEEFRATLAEHRAHLDLMVTSAGREA